MAQLLFSHSYFYPFDPKQWTTAQPYPPYGTIYAAAFMRTLGHEVGLFDTALLDNITQLPLLLERQRPQYFIIYDDGFNYLTKMCLTRMREAAFDMIRLAKGHGCTVLVNSSDATDHYAEYLNKGADFVLLGEGEITLKELIETLESQKTGALPALPGIAWKPDGVTPFKNIPRPVATDLDQFPDPAWDLIDVEAYRQIWMDKHGYFSLNIATTRGCPYKCNWCAKPIYGNRYNSRSPKRVAGEIAFLMRTYNVTHFWMSDDIFGLKPRWIQEFNDAVKAQQLSFSYKIQSRADLLLKEDNIEALWQSGLRQVWIGAESGSQKILDAMDKGTTVEQIAEATRLLKAKGIEVCFFLQYGYLGETRHDIDLTLQMVETLLPHDIGISVSYPLPGTGFYEKVRNTMGKKQNWTDSDDLDLMYPSTFSPAFYKRLHRYTHKRFRLKQGLFALKNIFSGQKIPLRRVALLLYYFPAAFIDGLKLQRLQRPN